jgi:hypothetical protein
MLTKPPTAVESIGKRRSTPGRGFDLQLAFFADRFFAAMANTFGKGPRPFFDLTVTLPIGLAPILDATCHALRTKGLSRTVNKI